MTPTTPCAQSSVSSFAHLLFQTHQHDLISTASWFVTLTLSRQTHLVEKHDQTGTNTDTCRHVTVTNTRTADKTTPDCSKPTGVCFSRATCLQSRCKIKAVRVIGPVRNSTPLSGRQHRRATRSRCRHCGDLPRGTANLADLTLRFKGFSIFPQQP